jgi:hypothetical protein
MSSQQISSFVLWGTTTWRLQISALALASFIPLAASRATTLTVTSPADSGPGTLRDQIAASNPGDTIDFAFNGTILLNSAITIGNSISILGPGPMQMVISGNNVDRVFVITAGPVSLSGITVRDGKPFAPNGIDGGVGQDGTPGVDALGGAIYDTGGTLTLSNCWFTANQAIAGNGGRGGDNPAGAVFTPGKGGKGGNGEGGAIYNPGTVNATRCTFSANRAVGGKGGNGGNNLNPAVSKSGGTGGGGGEADWGAVFSSGPGPNMTLCTFSGNLAAGGDGGAGGATLATVVGGTGGDGNAGSCGAYLVSAQSLATSLPANPYWLSETQSSRRIMPMFIRTVTFLFRMTAIIMSATTTTPVAWGQSARASARLPRRSIRCWSRWRKTGPVCRRTSPQQIAPCSTPEPASR